jgi:hypothetical protein
VLLPEAEERCCKNNIQYANASQQPSDGPLHGSLAALLPIPTHSNTRPCPPLPHLQVKRLALLQVLGREAVPGTRVEVGEVGRVSQIIIVVELLGRNQAEQDLFPVPR